MESKVYLVQGKNDGGQTQKGVYVILRGSSEAEGNFDVVDECTQETLPKVQP